MFYNTCFPIKRIKIGYKTRKFWLPENIKSSIHVKNELYKKWKKWRSDSCLLQYKKYKTNLEKVMNMLERNHLQQQFDLYKNNLSRSWKLMKEIINKKNASPMPQYFEISGKPCYDKKQIANSFNSFYINIGPSLASESGSDTDRPSVSSYLNNRVINSIFLEPVTQLEVKKIISALKISSPGWDDIAPKVVKECQELLLVPLTHVFNLSLTEGVFPTELKLAKVLPLYKGEDSTLIKNYRPVSVLPLFFLKY